jgi:hypothetical protein
MTPAAGAAESVNVADYVAGFGPFNSEHDSDPPASNTPAANGDNAPEGLGGAHPPTDGLDGSDARDDDPAQSDQETDAPQSNPEPPKKKRRLGERDPAYRPPRASGRGSAADVDGDNPERPATPVDNPAVATAAVSPDNDDGMDLEPDQREEDRSREVSVGGGSSYHGAELQDGSFSVSISSKRCTDSSLTCNSLKNLLPTPLTDLHQDDAIDQGSGDQPNATASDFEIQPDQPFDESIGGVRISDLTLLIPMFHSGEITIALLLVRLQPVRQFWIRPRKSTHPRAIKQARPPRPWIRVLKI